MAEYEFICRQCNHHLVIEQKWSDERPTLCKQEYDIVVGSKGNRLITETHICNGPLRRVWSMPNTIYRAGGFQTTDDRLTPDPDYIDDGS